MPNHDINNYDSDSESNTEDLVIERPRLKGIALTLHEKAKGRESILNVY